MADAGIAMAIAREVRGELDWLNPGVAADIHNPRAPDPTAIARAMLASAPVDIALVDDKHRRKKLLIANMDSTMIQQ